MDLYFEKSGQGDAIILLHGNGETHELFDEIAALLSKKYTVYAVDSRCHGKSPQGQLSYRLMANDIEELIEKEGIANPIIYGFSDGGIVALLLAISCGERIKKLIISGANLCPSGIKKRYLFLFKLIYLFSKNKLFGLMLKEPNINPLELKKINVPVLITAGKRDIIKEKHTKLIASSIADSSLLMLKGENHFSYVKNNKKLYKTIQAFL